jgi:hypothetical protein
MFTKIKEFLFGKPTQLEVEIKSTVPYKVEAPAPVGEPANDRVEAPAPVAEATPTAKNPRARKPAVPKTQSTPKPPAVPKKAPAKKRQFNKAPVAKKVT